ncbi:MAG: histidine kinase, partial [Clostridiales bacterium]|nr:histidine kinase [Clostridiales bacterium]
MREYLNFKQANCKNCYKCLRECPVKAITVIGDRARIRDDLCVLCGHCTGVCTFNAKQVVNDTAAVKKLLGGKKRVIASVAPAFAASFSPDFAAFSVALRKLGFSEVFETADGAREVSDRYHKLLESGKYRNLIASACPSIVRLIRLYYPEALAYLAPVVSPMVAHAKLLRQKYPDCKIVFLGPCIAKKQEADESGIIDAALTFEELSALFREAEIDPTAESEAAATATVGETKNAARYYPINRGIIKSFDGFHPDYEYISVDGLARAKEVLANIETLSGMFIEMHACEFSCINGPCALHKECGGFIKATETVRSYAKTGAADLPPVSDTDLS